MHAVTEQLSRSIAAAAAVIAATLADQDAGTVARISADLAARLDALAGEAAFSDMLPALREAELQALQITLSVCEAGLPKETGDTIGPGRAFYLAAVQFSATQLAAMTAARGLSGRRRSKRASSRSDSQAEANRPLQQVRLSAEERLLSDLDLALGLQRIPERFLALFLDTEQRGTSWFDAFSLYVAWYIRSDGAVKASLCETQVPGLEELGLDMAALLERLFESSKATALRLESRLAEAEIAGELPEDPPNFEIAAFLARLPGEIARRNGVPEAALDGILRKLVVAGFDPVRLEERLSADGERLAALLTDLAPVAGADATGTAARGMAYSLVAEGKFEEAFTAIGQLTESAQRARMLGAVKALAGSWVEARSHANRAIELVGAADRKLAIRAAVELAEAMAKAPGETVRVGAYDLCKTLLSAGDAELETALRLRTLLVATDLAMSGLKAQRQLAALTFVSGQLADAIAQPANSTDAVKARLCRARGDVALALTIHGADRTREAGRMFTEGLVYATLADDARLLSELHVRNGDVLMRQSRAASATEAPGYRLAAHDAYRAALVAGLRARDPIWWTEVKIRISESAVAIGGAVGDADLIRDGLISAKAALRLTAGELMPARHRFALSVLGDGFAALAKSETARRWRDHAVDTYDVAVASTDPAVHPAP